MDPLRSNPSYPTWSPPKSVPFEGYNLPPPSSQLSELGRLEHYGCQPAHEEPGSVGPDVRNALQLLTSLGLNQRQIRKLRKLEYRTAVACLAHMHEDEVDAACAILYSEQPHLLSQRPRVRRSNQSSSQYWSGVPSLTSDKSSLRGSVATDFSLPMHETSGRGSAYMANMSHPPSQWNGLPDDTHIAPVGCVQDNHMAFSAIPEDDQLFYKTNPQSIDHVDFSVHLRNHQVGPPVSPDTAAIPPPPRAGERNFSKLNPVNQSFFISDQEQARNRSMKIRFPCPESGCPKTFTSRTELAKHLTGDHDKNVTFTCKHRNCSHYPFETNRGEMLKRHHSTQHRECPGYDGCMQETRFRERKYWGCGLCRNLFTDAKAYAAHYKDHFEHDKFQQSDISFSTIIRSLLTQDATRDRWNKRNADRHIEGRISLSWEADDSSDIREALEYGLFEGSSISEANVVDRLLNQLLAQAIPQSLRHASPSSYQ